MFAKIRMVLALLLWASAGVAFAGLPNFRPLPTGGAYAESNFKGVKYGLFRANPAQVSLHWRDKDGHDYRRLAPLLRDLEDHGQQVAMLMNAGIYTKNDYPAGLWIENGKRLKDINTLDGAGNFHIQPNGVFFITGQRAFVVTTAAYLQGGFHPDWAVQSGPMLLINGQINRRFSKDLSSPYKRNAVCTTADGALYFILTESYDSDSEWPSFYRLAEALQSFGCRDALYLDGSISAWYIPEISSTFHWTHFTGMIAVTKDKKEDNNGQ